MNDVFYLTAETLPEYIKKADETILRPKTLYKWDDIITGVYVKRENGSTQKMWAVAANTFRGFYRKEGCLGASTVFHDYFVSNKNRLIAEILSIRNSEDLHHVEENICTDIRANLSNIIKNSIASYGKIRKPVDLYFQNLICMSQELDRSRVDLVPLLFLALDSQIFADPNIFTDGELKIFRLSRRSTYKDVTDVKMYLQLQNIISSKATQHSKAGAQFYRIYFDMLWNNRHINWGSNFFETNPSR